MQLTRDNVLWFAGLFEGEGHFEVRRTQPTKSPGLAIKMTDRDVLEKAQRMFGGWIWDGAKKYKAHHKQSFMWKLSERDKAYALVAAMFRFLGARRRAQAAEWIEKYKSLPTIGRSTRHGFSSTYVVNKCRCDACRSAYRAYRGVPESAARKPRKSPQVIEFSVLPIQ